MTVKTKKSNPCYGCSDRQIGCHSKCQKYQEQRAANEAHMAELRKKAALDAVVYKMNVDASRKRKRRKNLQ